MDSPTFGDKYVGRQFNPSNNPDVDRLKALYAEIIDILNNKRTEVGGHHAEDSTGDPEAGEKSRLYSISITKAQDAQMWAVKAVTY